MSLTYLGLNIFPRKDLSDSLQYLAVFPDIYSNHAFGILYLYCRKCWFFHLRQAKEHDAIYQILHQSFTKDAKQIIFKEEISSAITDLESWCIKACLATSSDRDALFLLAIESGHAWLLRRMLIHDPTMAFWDLTGIESPLVYAAYQGHPDVVNTLLDFDMDINVTSGPLGKIPPFYSQIRLLHLAIIMGRTQIIKILIERGADVDAVSERSAPSGRSTLEWAATPVTTMHVAARYGTPAVVAILLEQGLDPNEVDQEGRSALHYAVYVDDHELQMVRKLVQLGVDPTIKDFLGQTSLSYALTLPNQSFIEYAQSESDLKSAFQSGLELISSVEAEWARPPREVPLPVESHEVSHHDP